MLTIPIELWPAGSEKKKSVLYQIQITNDLTGTDELANYQVVLLSYNNQPAVAASLHGVNRTHGPLALLDKALAVLKQAAPHLFGPA